MSERNGPCRYQRAGRKARAYVGGHAPSLSIAALAPALGARFSAGWALVTMIDSNPAPSAIVPLVRQLASLGGRHVRCLDAALLVTGAPLAWMLSSGDVFYGFDEVYLMDAEPDAVVVPQERFTADIVQFAGCIPEECLDIVAQLRAEAFLGDGTGIGLNFLLTDTPRNFQVLKAIQVTGHHT